MNEFLWTMGIIVAVVVLIGCVGYVSSRISDTNWCIKRGFAGSERWRGNVACVGYDESGQFVAVPQANLE